MHFQNRNEGLFQATRIGDVQLVRSLLAWCDPRANGNRALRLASGCGHEDVVRTLLAWRGLQNQWCDLRAVDNHAANVARMASGCDPRADINGHRITVMQTSCRRCLRGGDCIITGATLEQTTIIVQGSCGRCLHGEWCDVSTARAACLAGMPSHQALLLDACDLEEIAQREWTRVRAAWVAAVVRNRLKKMQPNCTSKNVQRMLAWPTSN